AADSIQYRNCSSSCDGRICSIRAGARAQFTTGRLLCLRHRLQLLRLHVIACEFNELASGFSVCRYRCFVLAFVFAGAAQALACARSDCMLISVSRRSARVNATDIFPAAGLVIIFPIRFPKTETCLLMAAAGVFRSGFNGNPIDSNAGDDPPFQQSFRFELLCIQRLVTESVSTSGTDCSKFPWRYNSTVAALLLGTKH